MCKSFLESNCENCNFHCNDCWQEKSLCTTWKEAGIREWHPAARPCTQCHNSKKTCQRLLQFGWCTDCESKQKAFLERLAQRYPEEYQLSMPDPPHNIKSVRSSLFWYWLFLDDYLINIRMLPIIRRDQDDNIARPMKQAVTMKALKNIDRMSVETALEVISPSDQSAMPYELIVATIVPEIYTFWRQNRPGAVACPMMQLCPNILERCFSLTLLQTKLSCVICIAQRRWRLWQEKTV